MATARRIPRKPVPTYYPDRYPLPDPEDPLASLSVLRNRASSALSSAIPSPSPPQPYYASSRHYASQDTFHNITPTPSPSPHHRHTRRVSLLSASQHGTPSDLSAIVDSYRTMPPSSPALSFHRPAPRSAHYTPYSQINQQALAFPTMPLPSTPHTSNINIISTPPRSHDSHDYCYTSETDFELDTATDTEDLSCSHQALSDVNTNTITNHLHPIINASLNTAPLPSAPIPAANKSSSSQFPRFLLPKNASLFNTHINENRVARPTTNRNIALPSNPNTVGNRRPSLNATSSLSEFRSLSKSSISPPQAVVSTVTWESNRNSSQLAHAVDSSVATAPKHEPVRIARVSTTPVNGCYPIAETHDANLTAFPSLAKLISLDTQLPHTPSPPRPQGKKASILNFNPFVRSSTRVSSPLTISSAMSEAGHDELELGYASESNIKKESKSKSHKPGLRSLSFSLLNMGMTHDKIKNKESSKYHPTRPLLNETRSSHSEHQREDLELEPSMHSISNSSMVDISMALPRATPSLPIPPSRVSEALPADASYARTRQYSKPIEHLDLDITDAQVYMSPRRAPIPPNMPEPGAKYGEASARCCSPSSSPVRFPPSTSPIPFPIAPSRLLPTPIPADSSLSSPHPLPTCTELYLAASLPLLSEDGKQITFGSLFSSQRAIIIFIRHFWCPLCQDYMDSVNSVVKGEMVASLGYKDNGNVGETGVVSLVVISNGAYGMIDKYRQMCRLPFRVYTDPSMAVYRALGMGRDGGVGACAGSPEMVHYQKVRNLQGQTQRLRKQRNPSLSTFGPANANNSKGFSEKEKERRSQQMSPRFVVDHNGRLGLIPTPNTAGKSKNAHSASGGKQGSYVKHGPVTGLARVVLRAIKVGMPVWEKGGDIHQLGGEFVLGPGLSCSYAHRMQTTRGHAPIEDVLAAAGIVLPVVEPSAAYYSQMRQKNQQNSLSLSSIKYRPITQDNNVVIDISMANEYLNDSDQTFITPFSDHPARNGNGGFDHDAAKILFPVAQQPQQQSESRSRCASLRTLKESATLSRAISSHNNTSVGGMLVPRREISGRRFSIGHGFNTASGAVGNGYGPAGIGMQQMTSSSSSRDKERELEDRWMKERQRSLEELQKKKEARRAWGSGSTSPTSVGAKNGTASSVQASYHDVVRVGGHATSTSSATQHQLRLGGGGEGKENLDLDLDSVEVDVEMEVTRANGHGYRHVHFRGGQAYKNGYAHSPSRGGIADRNELRRRSLDTTSIAYTYESGGRYTNNNGSGGAVTVPMRT